jgi:hypothetical protein
MKPIGLSVLLIAASALAGCAIFREPTPTEARTGTDRERVDADREGWVAARARELEKKGLNADAAKIEAAREYRQSSAGRSAAS